MAHPLPIARWLVSTFPAMRKPKPDLILRPRCKALAHSTGERCTGRSTADSDYCPGHRLRYGPRPPEEIDRAAAERRSARTARIGREPKGEAWVGPHLSEAERIERAIRQRDMAHPNPTPNDLPPERPGLCNAPIRKGAPGGRSRKNDRCTKPAGFCPLHGSEGRAAKAAEFAW